MSSDWVVSGLAFWIRVMQSPLRSILPGTGTVISIWAMQCRGAAALTDRSPAC